MAVATRRGPAGAGELVAGGPTRREVLASAGLLAGAGVLAACGAPATSPPATGSGDGATSPAAAGGASGAPDAAALARLADIPVGGAVAATLDGQPILLVQPEAGTVVGLSAICTHQQCTVQPDDDRLLCPCHGSVFSLDGDNVSGPAPRPLDAVAVHVSGDDVLAGAG